MTPEEINVAVAELCGWGLGARPYKNTAAVEYGWINPRGEFVRASQGRPPNYYSDLNACAEMEKTLAKDYGADRSKFFAWLLVAMECVEDFDEAKAVSVNAYHCERIVSATAPQRCEAFLRVKGKWMGEV